MHRYIQCRNRKYGLATDRIEFADNYYMVTTFGSAGSEPASFITNMKLYSYDGEMLASSHNDSYLGGDYLDKNEYPCNCRRRSTIFMGLLSSGKIEGCRFDFILRRFKSEISFLSGNLL